MTAVGGTPLINAEHGSGATGSSNPDMNGFLLQMQQMQAELVRLQTMVGSNVSIDQPTGYSSVTGSNLNSRDFKRVSAFDGDQKQYRDWKFDVFVSIGQVDSRLSTELQSPLSRKDRAEFSGVDDNDDDASRDTVESTRIEPFLGENRVILDYLI